MLSSRSKTVLNVIVGDYIREATPISSEAIARRSELNVSAATIRSDVVELEQEGFIMRPHTSSGSVPLDKGYRFYVGAVGEPKLDYIPAHVRGFIHREMTEVERDVEDWSRVAAAVLARLVDNMAIATFPKSKESRVKHIELVRLQDVLALLIVVFEQATVRRQLIRFSKPITEDSMLRSSNRLKHKLVGLTRREIKERQVSFDPYDNDLVSSAMVMLEEEDRIEHRDHYLDGLRNLLDQPEFSDKENVRGFVKSLEDGSLARAILDEVPEAGLINVVIGQENRGNMLWPFSVIIGRYGVPGEATGAVGAVGPIRMEYSRTIAGVGLMAEVMSEMVENVSER